jgi:simple sugar transport system permease protein
MTGSILAILASTIRLAVPYSLAGLGGTYSERSGVVNIGLEGMMLTGAFTAVAVTNITGSPWLGLLASIMSGILLGVIHAVVCVTFRSDQIVSGLAINIFAMGITVFLSWLLFNKTQIKAEGMLHVPILHDLPGFRVLFSELPPLPLTLFSLKQYSDFDCAPSVSTPKPPTPLESVYTKCDMQAS